MLFETLFYMILITTELHGSFIYTIDKNSKTDIDCIYAYMTDINYDYNQNIHINYLTPYCRRLSFNDSIIDVEGNVENVITFQDLHSQHVTSEELLQWSSSIDIIQDYEIYLTINNSEFAETKFYNCSKFWFGSRCQYTFNLNQSIESFGDFVISSFRRRETFFSEDKTFSCYPHLSGCYRGPEPMCLDWREICDGKIDCIGENFGIDENHCEQLQMKECQENEYRCHSDGQCIPLEFFHDGFTNNDCLDGTDEEPTRNLQYRFTELDFNCLTTMFFSCEEKRCNSALLFSCGDGQCIRRMISSIHQNDIRCLSTDRDHTYDSSLLYIPLYISLDCYLSAFHQFEHDFFVKNITNFVSFDHCAIANVSITPSVQLILAYFHLYYSSKTLPDKYVSVVRPHFICNNLEQYIFLPELTFRILTLYCYRSLVVFSRKYRENIFNWIDLTKRLNIAYLHLINKPKKFSHSYYDEDELSSSYSRLNSSTNMDTRYQYSHICIGVFEEDYFYHTNCELWSCYNPYTRCDGFFQCLNGIDELGCPSLTCNENQLECHDNNIPSKINCIDYDYIYEDTYQQKLFYVNHSLVDTKYLAWKTKHLLTTSDNLITLQQLQIYHIDNHTEFCQLNFFILDKMLTYSLRYSSQLFLGYLPAVENLSSQQEYIDIKSKENFVLNEDYQFIEHCYRGILIYESKSKAKRCLCPPNYFGDRCQWQNQRVSLTLQIERLISTEKKSSIFEIFIYLIDDETKSIENYEQILYNPSTDCQIKFNRYLLYSTRPKNVNKTYSLHIDIYDKITLNYSGSWYLPVEFSFLPVNRIVRKLFLPSDVSYLANNCSLYCGIHGQCYNYINSYRSFCRNKTQCSCSPDSICLHSSICLCPLNKFGSKCYLKHSACQPTNPCQNNGQCIPVDQRIHQNDFICLCSENYSGRNCEFNSTKIEIHFEQTNIPRIIFAHFITAFLGTKPHEQMTKFQKIPFNQNSVTLFTEKIFHILLIEFLDKSIYLSVSRETFFPSQIISVQIHSDFKCPNITDLLNSTILNLTYPHRIKFYQKPCLKDSKLKCFYDEKHICICDQNRFANCFQFNFYVNTSQCLKADRCQNNGVCFPDRTTCPERILCKCEKCFYGSHCELTTQSFSLSLDNMLGYHIKPFVSFAQQTVAVQITTAITVIMFIFGFINGFLSIITFQRKSIMSIGCGFYLLTNSVISLLMISLFTMKYFQLILFQTKLLTNEIVMYYACLFTDFLLKILLSINDWLNATVAIERAVTSIQGLNFNKSKSRYTAKRVIPIIFILVSCSYIHDPLSRKLYDDKDEQKILCIADYSSKLKNNYDKFISIFHFVIPFIINMICAITVIMQVIQTRVKLRKNSSQHMVFRKEIKRHKHLIISPLILILLNVPRLIITFLSACMESPSNPWLFLVGYYISFIPPLSIFSIFILPSEKYKDEFLKAMKEIHFISCFLFRDRAR